MWLSTVPAPCLCQTAFPAVWPSSAERAGCPALCAGSETECRMLLLLTPGPRSAWPVTLLSFTADSSSKQTLQVPGSRAAAPRPPVPASNSRPQDDVDNSRASPPELPRTQRPSLPDLSRPNTAGSTGMKHSSSAPPPPPPGRRTTAPPAPPPAHGAKVSSYNREKPLPPTPGQRLSVSRDGPPAPPPIKPPPSPVSIRTGSGAQGQSLAPPPPPYRQPPGVPNGPSSPSNESAPELPQRHNSLHRKTPGPVRGLAPPPPASASPSLQSSRPPPPARDPPSRGAGKSYLLCWTRLLHAWEQPWWVRLRPLAHGVFGGW